MRFFPVLIALLMLPALTLVHRYYYYQKMLPRLEANIKGALSGPEYVQVKTKMSYLDTTLEGEVPTLAAREYAWERVAAVQGVRCPAENNHTVVPSHIEAQFEEERLVMHGLLRDDATLRKIIQWLKTGRPDLQITTDEVALSPHVMAMEISDNHALSPELRAIWALVEVPPSLKITRKGSGFVATGYLPRKELRDAILGALLGTKRETSVEAMELRSGTYVRNVRFTDAEALPELVRRYFDLGDTASFEADEHGAIFSANVTQATMAEWMPLLDKLGYAETAHANMRVFPSIYHLPNHRPVSNLPAETLKELENVLRANAIRFEDNDDSATSAHGPKLNALGIAIAAAGPETHIVIGVHPGAGADTTAAQTLARKRAEDVVAQLVDRGVPAERLEIVAFSASLVPPGAVDPLVGRVELFVK